MDKLILLVSLSIHVKFLDVDPTYQRRKLQWRHYVGVTRGGNSGCHPYFFLKKLTTFLVITVCHFSGVTPLEKADDLFSSLSLFITFLLISLGCHPL